MFAGFELEDYKPGQQKMPFTLLTIFVVIGYYILMQTTAHVKKHSINKPYPPFSPILDEHFYFDDALLHRVMNQYHPKLLQEYIWLLVGRSVFIFVVAFWGVEMVLRSFSKAFFNSPIVQRGYPVEFLPMCSAALEIFINAITIFIMKDHPNHVHGLVTMAGWLTLLKHCIIYLTYGVVLLGVLGHLKNAVTQQKKLE